MGNSYKFVSGANSVWTRGSNDSLTFVIKNSKDDSSTFDKFDGIEIDGNETDQYDAKRGSLILSLRANYLNSLSNGEHKLRVYFDDGSISTTFTVREATNGTNGANGAGGTNATNGTGAKGTVQTGDDFDALRLFVSLLATISVAGCGIVLLKRKRKKLTA